MTEPKIKLKILSYDPSNHAMMIRYFTDIVTEEVQAIHDGHGNIARRADGTPVRCRSDFNIDIHVIPMPTGKELIKHIIATHPPHQNWFTTQEAILDPTRDTDMKGAEEMVGQVHDVVAPNAASGSLVLPNGAVSLRRRRSPEEAVTVAIL